MSKLVRKQFTRKECVTLEASGLLDPQYLELIEGDLISRIGKKPRHVDAVSLLSGLLIQVFGVRFVNQAASIDVAPEDNPTNERYPISLSSSGVFRIFYRPRPSPRT